MKKTLTLMLLLCVVTLFAKELPLSKFGHKKLMELIKDTYKEDYSITSLVVNDELQRQLAKGMPNGSLYIIKKGGSKVGYVYISQAEGRTETFDYAVVFDRNLTTEQVKMLDYRPPYGGAVASRFWLKQFANKGIEERFEFRKNVDSLSGATISATSIVDDMNLIKKNMVILHQQGVI